MPELIEHWGYLGVFLGIIVTGLGFPMPEELPIVLGGAMATNGKVEIYYMLPVCIVGVIIGDSFLYFIGRLWGAKLVDMPFVRKRLLTPEKLASISENFKTYGVKILLFARLTPGIRAPIFLAAGIAKLPLTQFLLADGIYAIPGVSLLFFLGYWSADTIIELIEAESRYVKPILVLVVIGGVAIYFVYHFWKKPVVTGNPTEMPPFVGPVTEKLEEVAESMAEKVADTVLPRSMHPGSEVKTSDVQSAVKKAEEEAAKKNAEEDAARNGQAHVPAEEKTPANPKGPITDGRQ
ncbi:MAG: DedA family protein [Planctomycetes bacterium]|nr:DedA family protein [Planctomycetota bacterium]